MPTSPPGVILTRHLLLLATFALISLLYPPLSTPLPSARYQDLIVMRDALKIVIPKLARCVDRFSNFAQEQKDLPTLGFTHMQLVMGEAGMFFLKNKFRDN